MDTMSGQSPDFWAYLETRLFGHHEPLRELLETLIRKQNTMSESLDQRLSDLTALVEKERDDNAKFRTDVTTALANLGTAGPMTAAQQAAFDNVMSIVKATDDATVAADAALPSAAPPAA